MRRVWLDTGVFLPIFYRIAYFGMHEIKDNNLEIVQEGDYVKVIVNGEVTCREKREYFVKNLKDYLEIWVSDRDSPQAITSKVLLRKNKLNEIVDAWKKLQKYYVCVILEPEGYPQRLLSIFNARTHVTTYLTTDFVKLFSYVRDIRVKLYKLEELTVTPEKSVKITRGIGRQISTEEVQLLRIIYDALADITKLREALKVLSRRKKGKIYDYPVDAWLILLSLSEGNIVITKDGDVAYFSLRINRVIEQDKLLSEYYKTCLNLKEAVNVVENMNKGIIYVSSI